MSLRLHPTLGLNPRLTTCPRCGKDSDGIVLLGISNSVRECNSCGKHLIGGLNKDGTCPACGDKTSTTKIRELDDHEKIPGDLCSACQEGDRLAREAVEAGGIYWRCTTCHSAGAIQASSPMAQDVRKHMKIEAPEPCGIEFEKCPVCDPNFYGDADADGTEK